MPWNDKYWDALSNIYWTPRYLGLKSIPRDKWRMDGEWVSVPAELIANRSGPLYSRNKTADETRAYLNGQEEILNQIFNITFAIAADDIVSRLLCAPLGIVDAGPFESLGREVKSRYGWRKDENVTQQDGLFVSAQALVGVELKLGSKSWPEQIAKYVALMVWEGDHSGARRDLGLIFIVPETAIADHWQSVGIDGARIDEKFLTQLDRDKLPEKIRSLFETRPDDVAAVLRRLRLAVISWRMFRDNITVVETEANSLEPGGQTIQRLLRGLRAQIEVHDNTGIDVAQAN